MGIRYASVHGELCIPSFSWHCSWDDAKESCSFRYDQVHGISRRFSHARNRKWYRHAKFIRNLKMHFDEQLINDDHAFIIDDTRIRRMKYLKFFDYREMQRSWKFQNKSKKQWEKPNVKRH